MKDYNECWEFKLEENEKNQLKKIIDELPRLNRFDEIDDAFLNELEVVKSKLPVRILKELVSFKRSSNLYGTIKFSNLPTDASLPITPEKGEFAKGKVTNVSEYILLLFMLCLGEPLAYEDEKGGLLIQNICPVKGEEKKQENTGSDLLEFHTEDGFHPYKPDFLALYCVKSDRDNKAKTITSSIRRVLKHLPNDAIEILREPLYAIKPPSSFGNENQDDLLQTIPVLSGTLLDPEICMDFYLMKPQNELAAWALDCLKKELLNASIGVILQKGELLIVDNKKAIHARTEFVPKYDGEDRWLQRMFVVRDIHASVASRSFGKRICSPVNVILGQKNQRYKELVLNGE
ncbi:TauD/TfdA family dioxygenase [Bacillus cereus]|nr:TauD/TfdA family dioxygenase [Bacillus cereus]